MRQSPRPERVHDGGPGGSKKLGWRLDPPGWRGKLTLGFINAVLEIVHQGFFYLNPVSSVSGWRFVLAFPNIKAHGTALEAHGPLITILENSKMHR